MKYRANSSTNTCGDDHADTRTRFQVATAVWTIEFSFHHAFGKSTDGFGAVGAIFFKHWIFFRKPAIE